MKELLKKFEDKTPEIVFEWSDSETEAEGWAVINSLRNGAAGGGTRMRKGKQCKCVISDVRMCSGPCEGALYLMLVYRSKGLV